MTQTAKDLPALDLAAIQYGAVLARMTTAAEFSSAIDTLTSRLIDHQKRRADLLVAKDQAAFGDGDMDAIRADLVRCEGDIDTIETQIAVAARKREASERQEDAEAVGEIVKTLSGKADELGHRFADFRVAIEAARHALFQAEAATMEVERLNNRLIGEGHSDLIVNTDRIRRLAFDGEKAKMPEAITRRFVVNADRILLSFMSAGGPLRNRMTVNPNPGVDLSTAIVSKSQFRN